MTAFLAAALALVVPNTNITFEWAPPTSGSPAYYKVLVENESVGGNEIFYSTQASVTLALTPGRNVSLRVSACDNGACGVWSEASQVFSLNYSADASGDSVVGLQDFRIMLADVGRASEHELTGDGLMGLEDVSVWRKKLGQCIGNISLDESAVQAYLPCDLVFP